MEFDYLKNFTKRMNKIGSYALLFRNSMQKSTWKKYGFDEFYEQTNFIFTILMFLMEQSLKEENCTIDDIGSFIDTINMRWFKKGMSFEECKELGDFVINTVLCDEGRVMYFPGFNFEKGVYEESAVSFVQNKVVYVEGDVKRTSYYLTEEGYQLLLSTLEIENNMMLTVQEMIFKLHLEKASYDKAVDDIKNIFNRFRIQLQKIKDDMHRIRKNALLYSVSDYKSILEDNLYIIEETKIKFIEYREHVKKRVSSLEEKDINIRRLNMEEAQNLKDLRTIEYYLNRALDEHQKILSLHFDLKFLYTKELEELSQMSLIKRFQLRSEVYDKVLEDVNTLEDIHYFLMPLFSQELPKVYNINKSLEIQKPIREKLKDDEGQIFEIEDENWKEEIKKKHIENQNKYKKCLSVILCYAAGQKKISLSSIKSMLNEDELNRLIPTVEIFKEIMVELIKIHVIDIEVLQEEQNEKYIHELNKLKKEESAKHSEILDKTNSRNDKKHDLDKVQKDVSSYSSYKEGELINKDIEDLIARFFAITMESAEEESLKDQLDRANERFKESENELINYAKRHSINEKEYKKTIYDRFLEEELEDKITSKEKQKNEESQKRADLIRKKQFWNMISLRV